MKLISKEELKYILYATIFSVFLFVIIIPNLPLMDGISPYIQFIIFNLAILFFLQIFLKSIISQKKLKWGYSIGILILFIALDIVVPPLSINTSGQFAQNVTLIQSSSDYTIGLFWTNFNISGFALYVFTYVITPFILFLIASIILKNIVKEL